MKIDPIKKTDPYGRPIWHPKEEPQRQLRKRRGLPRTPEEESEEEDIRTDITGRPFRDFTDPNPGIQIPDHLGKYEADILEAADRALAAGAEPPLEAIGIGMTSVVFCGAEGRAWKTARRIDDINGQMLEEEFEFLSAASRVPGIRDLVVAVYSWDPENMVIEKNCLSGRPGVWADDSRLREFHNEISDGMIPHGWCCPEFKEDSYVFVGAQDWHDEGDGPVLVDGGMALRVGDVLLDYAEEVLVGEREWPQRLDEIAYAIRAEIRKGTIDENDGNDILERINGR